jgi:MFS family permease
MLFNSLYQYSWNALEPLLRSTFKAGVLEVQVGYAIFNIFSSIFQVIGGYIADVKGPKIIGIFSSISSSLGFLGTYLSPNLFTFYVFWAVGSSGEGILYGIATNLAVKWYSNRRGIAIGIVSLGFGLGATIANPLIAKFSNAREPSLIIGLLELAILPSILYFTDYPTSVTGRKFIEIALTKEWWLIFASYSLVLTPLLTYSSSLTEIGSSLPRSQLQLIISLFPLMSGLGRPFLGVISDRLGTMKTLLMINSLLSLSQIIVLINVFLSSTLIGILGGAMITLYFSLIGELYGSKYSTSNIGILYAGKAISGFLGSIAFNYIYLAGGIFYVLYLVLLSVIGTALLIICKMING